jgi:hypothetical protein
MAPFLNGGDETTWRESEEKRLGRFCAEAMTLFYLPVNFRHPQSSPSPVAGLDPAPELREQLLSPASHARRVMRARRDGRAVNRRVRPATKAASRTVRPLVSSTGTTRGLGSSVWSVRACVRTRHPSAMMASSVSHAELARIIPHSPREARLAVLTPSSAVSRALPAALSVIA